MIGVISKPEQTAIVEEFFELFKTPWEFYEQGRRYDVVVATTVDMPEVNTGLLLAYGSESKNIDTRNKIAVLSMQEGGALNYQGVSLPIYGRLATFAQGNNNSPCVTAAFGIAGLHLETAGVPVLRLGYDLFEEVRHLLSTGQPIDQAHIPTLDMHIRMLRNFILSEGIPVLEVPPAPAGHSFMVCLTHDIDFVGIRNHKFDHTMWGFLYRATVGSVRNLFRRRISIARFFDSWLAAASLPFVYLGWAKDFWAPFEWYLEVEKNLPATYFLIPFKRRAGERVPGRNGYKRATAYDVGDLLQWTAGLKQAGCEVGVHGLDAWHSVEKGSAELARVAGITGDSSIGIRMHWLLRDANTISVLEKSGYAYDSTSGYNDTVGYRAGTTQVFRPLDAKTLMELPLHIQDGALFYPEKLDLSEPEAEKRCRGLIDNARQSGGVLTVLWHDRSHGPERFWGDFYIPLIQELKSFDAWFATAGQAVSWFRKRREVRFERATAEGGVRSSLHHDHEAALPDVRLRVYRPSGRRSDGSVPGEADYTITDILWKAGTVVDFDSSLNSVSQVAVGL